MKGALACYVEAVRALQDAGVRLKGDVLIAAVCGEIEKTQWGDEFRGTEYRGYAAGSRYLVSHGGVADMCVLGEPTEQRIVLGHYGSIWLRSRRHAGRSSTPRSAADAPRRTRSCACATVLDAVLEWIPEWQAPHVVRRQARRRQRRLDPGRLSLARVADAGAHRPLPRRARAADDADGGGARRARRLGARACRSASPTTASTGEVYVTAPGAEIEEGHELVPAIDESHTEVYGSAPERDTVRWFSDATVLTRYGDPDRQLRHVERASRHRGREPRDPTGWSTPRGSTRSAARARSAGWRTEPLPAARRTCRRRSTTAPATTSQGMAVPALELESSLGPVDLAELGAERAVLYVYPRTGRPGRPVPESWDAIPGARGCTPQSCGFRDHAEELRGARRRASPASRRRRSRSRSSSPSGSAHALSR